MDYTAHNEEVERVWKAYHEGRPVRVPMSLAINTRFTAHQPGAHDEPLNWERYFTDTDYMVRYQVEHVAWVKTHVPMDHKMGLPDEWTVWVDYQNTYEAAWFGAPVHFVADEVPDTDPIVTDENKHEFLRRGVPDPESGPQISEAWRRYEELKQKEAEGFELMGRPVRCTGISHAGTDGPFTVACNLRGAGEFCMDLLDDPEWADAFLTLITDSIIVRQRAIRRRLGQPERGGYGFADDSSMMLSVPTYVERLLPHHRRLVDELGDGSPIGIHLCGNATHLFPTMVRELGVGSFETGFPVDFGGLRKQLGPGVALIGGPSVPFLDQATPEQVRDEVRRILDSGVREGGKFILQDGNNLSPRVPMENLHAMYQACKEFGHYA